jgi:hypothetical protein
MAQVERIAIDSQPYTKEGMLGVDRGLMFAYPWYCFR